MAKFKKGDKVRALRNLQHDEIIKDQIYECLGPSDKYPADMIKIQGKSGRVVGWIQDAFELVEQSTTKHYKWNIKISVMEMKLYPNGPTEETNISWIESDHYVSEEKINDYINQYVVDKYGCNVLTFEKTKVFVED